MEYQIIDEKLKISSYDADTIQDLRGYSREQLRNNIMFYDESTAYLFINRKSDFYSPMLRFCRETLLLDIETMIKIDRAMTEYDSDFGKQTTSILIKAVKHRQEIEQAERTMAVLNMQPCRAVITGYVSKTLYDLMADNKEGTFTYGHFFNLGYINGIRTERARRKPRNEADFIRNQISQQAKMIKDIQRLRNILAFVDRTRELEGGCFQWLKEGKQRT